MRDFTTILILGILLIAFLTSNYFKGLSNIMTMSNDQLQEIEKETSGGDVTAWNVAMETFDFLRGGEKYRGNELDYFKVWYDWGFNRGEGE